MRDRKMKKHDYEKKKHRDMITDIIKFEHYKIIAEIGLEKCRMAKSVLKNCNDFTHLTFNTYLITK